MMEFTKEQLAGFRPMQKETIELIDEQFNKEKRVVLLDAPTGAGKSLINLVTANRRSGYVTTPQVLLVNQMADSIAKGGIYSNLGVTVMGKGNYPCRKLMEKNEGRYFSASGAPCSDCVYKENGGCAYYDIVAEAQGSRVAISTLAYTILAINRGIPNPNSGWGMRDTLVIDEAHSFDDAITTFFTVEITSNSFDKEFDFEELYVDARNCKSSNEILLVVKNHTESQIKILRERIKRLTDKGNKRTAEEDGLLVKYNRRLERMEHLLVKLDYEDIEYIISLDNQINIRPFSPAPFISKFLHSFNRVVLSSATFVNPSMLMANLGFKREEWVRIQVPSTFDPQKAPIIFDLVGKVNMKTMEIVKPKILERVQFYMKNYDERILVHCHSYAIANYLKENIDSPRIISHTSDDRNEALDAFTDSKDGVFLAVNMTEGLDLHDDLCRVQIIVKAPYPNLGDKWVKAHADRDGFKWYESKALLALIQASGRIVRNEKDSGMTIVLDENVSNIINRNKRGISEWFLDRIQKF